MKITKLIAKNRDDSIVKSWMISKELESQLYSLKEQVESFGLPFCIPVLLHAKDALNQKIEQDISNLDLTTQQFQDIAQFGKICQDIEQLPSPDVIKLIIEK